MKTLSNMLLALFFAPLLPLLLFWLLVPEDEGRAIFLFIAAVLMYLFMLLFGLPTPLILRKVKKDFLVGYLVSGVLIGLLSFAVIAAALAVSGASLVSLSPRELAYTAIVFAACGAVMNATQWLVYRLP